MSTVEERLASLEAKVETMSDLRNLIAALRADMNGRFTELREDTNRRFTEVRDDMNRGFDDVNRRLAALNQKGDRNFAWMVSTQVALLLAVVGALVGAYYR